MDFIAGGQESASLISWSAVPRVFADFNRDVVLPSELSDQDKKLEAFREALALLPASHNETLKYLMGHLKR